MEQSSKEKDKLLIIFAIIAISISILYNAAHAISGFQYSNFISRGKENAVAYVMEKYGFEPEIISVKADWRINDRYQVVGNRNNTLLVMMKYEEQSFRVYVTVEGESIEGSDNYQSKEIKAAVEDRLKDYLPGAVVLNVKTDYSDELMWTQYYDGTNIDDFIDGDEEAHNYIISTVGCDVEAVDLEKLAKVAKARYVIIYDYLSEDAFALAEKLEIDHPSGTDYNKADKTKTLERDYLDDRLPFLDEYAQLDHDDGEILTDYVKNNLKEIDGILYGSYDGSDVVMEPVDYTFDLNNYEYLENYEGQMQSYRISGNDEYKYLYIYIPVYSVSNDLSPNVQIIFTYIDENGEQQHGKEHIFRYSKHNLGHPYYQVSMYPGKGHKDKYKPYKDMIWTVVYK